MVKILKKLTAAIVLLATANAFATDPLNSAIQVYMPDRIINFQQCTYGLDEPMNGEIVFTSHCKIKKEQMLPAVNRRKVPYAVSPVSIGSLTTDPHEAFAFHASKCNVDSHHNESNTATLSVIRCER